MENDSKTMRDLASGMASHVLIDNLAKRKLERILGYLLEGNDIQYSISLQTQLIGILRHTIYRAADMVKLHIHSG